MFNVLSMQKIKGDVLSICFSDVLSAYLEQFWCSKCSCFDVLRTGSEILEKIDVLSGCPSL